MSGENGRALPAGGMMEDIGAGPARSNALLFYQLARFLVWGQQHKDLATSDPGFDRLLGEAAAVLASAGQCIESPNP